MAIDYHALKSRRFAEIEQAYGWKDSALYALAVGYGHDPLDARQLRFVFEASMQAAPTMAAVLATPGFWPQQPGSGIDWVRVLHGEQTLTLHRPLAPEGRVTGRGEVTALVDKGPQKGALIVHRHHLRDTASGEPVATLEQRLVARADGGFSARPGNGPAGGDPPPPPRPATPDTAPGLVCDLPTAPNAALLYRLCADVNPLHADPSVAARAGFVRPILHGLATFGVAGHAILRACCGYDASRLRSIGVRFSAPVYPGETIRTEIWQQGASVAFRARALERDILVLTHGTADID